MSGFWKVPEVDLISSKAAVAEDSKRPSTCVHGRKCVSTRVYACVLGWRGIWPIHPFPTVSTQ